MINCEECGEEIGTKEEIMEDMVEAHKVERNKTVEILCEGCYHEQPLGSLREDYEAETFEAKSKESVNQSITSNKIGESLAWDNRILGMAGQWRNGKYDINSIRQDADIIGYTIVHEDYLEKKLDWMENGVSLGSKSTDIAEINFAGMKIYTGGDGSFPVMGMYENVNDYYARTQNKPHPRGNMTVMEFFDREDYEEAKYEEAKWEYEFIEWVRQTYKPAPTYYDDGSEMPLYHHVAEKIGQENIPKLLVGARLSLHNPNMPTLNRRGSKSSIWVLQIPDLTHLKTTKYKQNYRGKTEVFINTETTVAKFFSNLKAIYPKGDFLEGSRNNRYKQFTINIPSFGEYRWYCHEVMLAYDSVSQNEEKRREGVKRQKELKKYKIQQEERMKELKEKYGAETFDVEFNEWADQEMMTHGKDISFKDWAEDEGMKHGNTEITEWAQHEDESHDARYGAESVNKRLALENAIEDWVKNNQPKTKSASRVKARIFTYSEEGDSENRFKTRKEIFGRNAGRLRLPKEGLVIVVSPIKKTKALMRHLWDLGLITNKVQYLNWKGYLVIPQKFYGAESFEAEEVDKETRKLLKGMAEKLYDTYGDEWFTSDGKKFEFYDEEDGESVRFSFSLDEWVIEEYIDWDKFDEVVRDRYSNYIWEDYMDTSSMEAFVKEMGMEHKIDADLYIDEGGRWLKRWQVNCLITIKKKKEMNAEFLYYYVLNEKGESPADFDTLEEAQAYVANSNEPLEIYERRNRDDEAYKMDKKMNAEGGGRIDEEGGRMVSIYHQTIVDYTWRTDPDDANVDEWRVQDEVEDKIKDEMHIGDSSYGTFYTYDNENNESVEVSYSWDKTTEDGDEEIIKSWAETDESFEAESWQNSRIQNLIDNLYDDREIALNKLLKIKNPSLQNLISKNAILRDKVGDMTLAQWAEVQNQLKYTLSGRIRTFGAEYMAERKKRSDLLSEPFEGTSLDSGDWKGIVVGFGIGLLGLFGYSKLRK